MGRKLRPWGLIFVVVLGFVLAGAPGLPIRVGIAASRLDRGRGQVFPTPTPPSRPITPIAFPTPVINAATPVPGASGTLAVTTTADVNLCPGGSGSPGYSLRCAILQIDRGLPVQSITFAIPSTDPGCQAVTYSGGTVATCTITLLSTLPSLTASGITIDGYSQSGSAPNNIAAPGGDNALLAVHLDGSAVSGDALTVANSAQVRIQGLAITNAHGGAGIAVNSSEHITISGNFLGTSADGSAGGNARGVSVSQSLDVTVGGTTPASRNVISNNTEIGVSVHAAQATITGNLIGTDGTGQVAAGNGVGLRVEDGASATIGGTGPGQVNVIAGSVGDGIDVVNGGQVQIVGNLIGGNGQQTGLGNGGKGIAISQYGQQTRVEHNVITDSGNDGVQIGSAGVGRAIPVVLHQNEMVGNQGLGIDVVPSQRSNCVVGVSAPANATPCPVISGTTATAISGTTCPGCTVEVYLVDSQQAGQDLAEGATYLGSVAAGSAGNWILQLSPGQFNPAKQQVTATATSNGNQAATSEFAVNMPIVVAFQSLMRQDVLGVIRPQPSGPATIGRVAVNVDWTMVTQTGLAGFMLTAGSTKLTAHPIPLDPGQTYHVSARWTGGGNLVLHVILINGVTFGVRPTVGPPIAPSQRTKGY